VARAYFFIELLLMSFLHFQILTLIWRKLITTTLEELGLIASSFEVDAESMGRRHRYSFWSDTVPQDPAR
jgi:hypothetical protein